MYCRCSTRRVVVSILLYQSFSCDVRAHLYTLENKLLLGQPRNTPCQSRRVSADQVDRGLAATTIRRHGMGIFSIFNAEKGLNKAHRCVLVVAAQHYVCDRVDMRVCIHTSQPTLYRRSQKLKVLWTLMGVTAASAGSAVVMDISTRVESPNTRLMLQSVVVFWCVWAMHPRCLPATRCTKQVLFHLQNCSSLCVGHRGGGCK